MNGDEAVTNKKIHIDDGLDVITKTLPKWKFAACTEM